MGAGRDEVAPRLTAEELAELKGCASHMSKGREREEFLAALGRAEKARRGRERLEHLRGQEPLADGEMSRLLAQAEVARRRANAARLALERHEITGEFEEWRVKDGDRVEGWSLAYAVNRLEADRRNRRLRSLVVLLKDAVGKKTEGLRAEAETSAGEARSLGERLRDALEVREAHGLGRPEAEYTPAQEREIEKHILAARDPGALVDLCRREFGRDPERAAGRGLAREIFLTVAAHADAAAYEEDDREIAEALDALPRRDPLAAKMKSYLEYRREERRSAAEFLEAAREIAAGQSEQYFELTGGAAKAVFTREEYEAVSGRVPKLADDREHDRIVKEINQAWIAREGGSLEQAGPLPFRRFHVREDNPRARAGLLIGEYLFRKAAFLELYETKQPYSEAMLQADAAKREMAGAVAQHRQAYGTEPVAVLSAEQADYVADVTGRYFSYATVTLRHEAESALVIGRSRGDLRAEVVMQTAPQRDAQGHEQQRADPTRSPGHSAQDRGDDFGGYSR